MKIKESIGYVAETGLLGAVMVVDLRNQNYILEDDEGTEYKFGFDKVEILEELFELHGATVFNKDVLGHTNGKLYMVTSTREGYIVLHELNDALEVVTSGNEARVENSSLVVNFEKVFDLQGSYYELLEALPKKPEFDIEIVKNFDEGSFNYLYACNDKEEEHIDIISVVFVGANILNNEYGRETITYEDYAKLLADRTLVKVSPQELANYALGVMSFNNKVDLDEYEYEDSDDEDCCEECCCTEDICEACDNLESKCSCEEDYEFSKEVEFDDEDEDLEEDLWN